MSLGMSLPTFTLQVPISLAGIAAGRCGASEDPPRLALSSYRTGRIASGQERRSAILRIAVSTRESCTSKAMTGQRWGKAGIAGTRPGSPR